MENGSVLVRGGNIVGVGETSARQSELYKSGIKSCIGANRFLWKRVRSSSPRNTSEASSPAETGADISREAWGAGW